jgi:hypothetical protein
MTDYAVEYARREIGLGDAIGARDGTFMLA